VLYFLIELEPGAGRRHHAAHSACSQGDWTPQLELAIDDAWKRLLNSSIQGEIRLELKQRSDTEAIRSSATILQSAAGAARRTDLRAGHRSRHAHRLQGRGGR
jgi:uncharacterized protein